jgi:hypothetical protein
LSKAAGTTCQDCKLPPSFLLLQVPQQSACKPSGSNKKMGRAATARARMRQTLFFTPLSSLDTSTAYAGLGQPFFRILASTKYFLNHQCAVYGVDKAPCPAQWPRKRQERRGRHLGTLGWNDLQASARWLDGWACIYSAQGKKSWVGGSHQLPPFKRRDVGLMRSPLSRSG